MTGKRTIVFLSHRASTSPEFPLDDLPGKGGRMDLVARVVTSSLLTAHGIRKDVELVLHLQGPPGPAVALRISGERVRGVNPDERSVAALIRRALSGPRTGPFWSEVLPGIEIAELDFPDLLSHLPFPWIRLDERGSEGSWERGTFFLGDDGGFLPSEVELLEKGRARTLRLSPTSLHADQAIVILHYLLDLAP